MAERRWLLLAYKVPRHPSASRVYVWRKLKRLGAVSVQDGVWVLPDGPRTKEQFGWLAAEITELGGDASVWEGNLTLKGQEDALVEQFDSAAEASYRQILVEVGRKRADLAVLSRQFQEARSRDFFENKLGRQVRQALLRAKDGSQR